MYGRGPNAPANGPPGPGGPGGAPAAAPAGPGGVGPGPVKSESAPYSASYSSNGYGGVSAVRMVFAFWLLKFSLEILAGRQSGIPRWILTGQQRTRLWQSRYTLS